MPTNKSAPLWRKADHHAFLRMNPSWPVSEQRPPDDSTVAEEFWKYHDEFQRFRFEYLFPQLSDEELSLFVDHYKNRWLLTVLVNHNRSKRPDAGFLERLTRQMEMRYMKSKAEIERLFAKLTDVQQNAVRERLLTIEFHDR